MSKHKKSIADPEFGISNETSGSDDIVQMVNKIRSKIDKLKTTTNLDLVIKEKDDVGIDIKNAETLLNKLKTTFETDTVCENDETFNFEKCFKEIEELYVQSANNADSIATQIERYNLLKHKINQCVSYLDTKKMQVKKIE